MTLKINNTGNIVSNVYNTSSSKNSVSFGHKNDEGDKFVSSEKRDEKKSFLQKALGFFKKSSLPLQEKQYEVAPLDSPKSMPEKEFRETVLVYQTKENKKLIADLDEQKQNELFDFFRQCVTNEDFTFLRARQFNGSDKNKIISHLIESPKDRAVYLERLNLLKSVLNPRDLVMYCNYADIFNEDIYKDLKDCSSKAKPAENINTAEKSIKKFTDTCKDKEVNDFLKTTGRAFIILNLINSDISSEILEKNLETGLRVIFKDKDWEKRRKSLFNFMEILKDKKDIIKDDNLGIKALENEPFSYVKYKNTEKIKQYPKAFEIAKQSGITDIENLTSERLAYTVAQINKQKNNPRLKRVLDFKMKDTNIQYYLLKNASDLAFDTVMKFNQNGFFKGITRDNIGTAVREIYTQDDKVLKMINDLELYKYVDLIKIDVNSRRCIYPLIDIVENGYFEEFKEYAKTAEKPRTSFDIKRLISLSPEAKTNLQKRNLMSEEEKFGINTVCFLSELDDENFEYLTKNNLIKKIGANEYRLRDVITYRFLKNKNNLNELNFSEKRKLFKLIVNYGEYRPPDEVMDFINTKLFPQGKDKLSVFVARLSKELGFDVKSLDKESLKNFYHALDSLSADDLDAPEKSVCFKTILDTFPELKPVLEEKSPNSSLNSLKNIMSKNEFKKLSLRDKHVVQMAALMQNITKDEIRNDENIQENSAFDSYFFLKRTDMTDSERLKLYHVIKNQNWFEQIEDLRQDIKKTAFKLRVDNSFKLANLLQKSKIEILQNPDVMNKFNTTVQKVTKLIEQIKNTAICLPQTKVPKASEITKGKNVKEIESDGVKNTVVYLEKGDDLSKYGFEQGLKSEDFNVLVHALDNENQSDIFQGLGLLNSDALLSTSYVNYGKGNIHVFRNNGFIINAQSEDLCAGYYRDFGSGFKKDINQLLTHYLFDGDSSFEQRSYISGLFKQKLSLNDEEYKKLYTEIKNKSLTQIQQFNLSAAKAIKEIFTEMEEGKRSCGRQYNEILVTRPQIQAVFTLNREMKDVPLFLRKYAQENNVPIIVFVP